ncbi:MAG: gamma-glutamyl-gamma-aminobutyrate hydrolase family protein [Bryobacteraceae bacterium]|jgi:putative glutamine amidotransferase
MIRRAALTYREPQKAEPYADALRDAGVEPVLLSPEHAGSLEGLSGLVLSGGTDLHPALYGGTPQPEDEPADTERDALESALLAQALERDLPILAICRGLQLFNVYHGGTLIQHLDNSLVHVVRDRDPAEAVHAIDMLAGSRLAAILGDGAHMVNSRHHQAVARIGDGLRVTARSVPDGVIEALEREDRRFALGVQWHPEDQARRDREQRKLFEAFSRELAGGIKRLAG